MFTVDNGEDDTFRARMPRKLRRQYAGAMYHACPPVAPRAQADHVLILSILALFNRSSPRHQ